MASALPALLCFALSVVPFMPLSPALLSFVLIAVAGHSVAVGGEPWFVEKQTVGVECVFFFLSSFASEVNHVPDKNEAVVW